MATGTLEIELLGAFVNTPMTSVASEPGEPSTTVFDIHDDVNVSVDWSIPDPLSRMIAGTFEVNIILESRGQGEEFEIGLPAIAVNPALTNYHADILIPANSDRSSPGENERTLQTDHNRHLQGCARHTRTDCRLRGASTGPILPGRITFTIHNLILLALTSGNPDRASSFTRKETLSK